MCVCGCSQDRAGLTGGGIGISVGRDVGGA